MTLTFDGKLYTSPAGKDRQLHRVLDAGTGTGIWAMDFGNSHTAIATELKRKLILEADEHPESHVCSVRSIEENTKH